MSVTVNPFALLLLVSGLATIILALVISSRLKQSERSFSFVLGLAGLWAVGSSGEHLSSTLSAMQFWLKFEYVGICFLPPMLLIFIRVFIATEKIPVKPYHAAIFALPIFTIFLVWTNDVHHLYYRSLTVDRSGAFPVLKIERSFWYYVFTAYWYLTLAWCIYLLATAFKRADPIYRKQKSIIIYALIVPWLANVVYKLRFNSPQNVDFTPYAFIVTAIIISYGLLRYKLLDIIPAAREKIFESMQDGALVLDTAGKVIDNNGQMQKILVDANKKITGCFLADLFTDQRNLQKVVAGRQKTTLEIKVVNNGQESYYEVDINILLDKASEYNGCILIFHDISQRKKDELSLAALNQLKDRIFSIISHDLRAPLINITALLKLMEEDVISEEELRLFLPELSKNLNYTTNLLDNLLHWSKSQLKGETINRKVVDIRNIVLHEILYYQQKAEEKEITLSQAIKKKTLVLADPEMIQLVIRNLIGNAIKFCSRNDHIIVSSNINTSNEVVICVKDTGSGMKAETVQKLFRPHAFTTRGTNNEQGTGLGLQLCKDFIEKNNGKIWVTTEWGKGSEFCFSLPAAPVLEAC